MKKCIFLDRDGTLIHEVHYLSQLSQIKLYKDVAISLKKLQTAGFLLIVITNQSGVARGYFKESFVIEAFEAINEKLKQEQVQLDTQYYCPHHLKGISPYNIACKCRKPQTEMIEKACKDFSIDLKNSWIVGDKFCDIAMANSMKINSILLETGHGKQEKNQVRQSFPNVHIAQYFSEATSFILQQNIRNN